MTPCSDIVGYQRFGRSEDGGNKVLRNISIPPHHYTVSEPKIWTQNVPPKRWYPTTSLHGVIMQKMEAAWSFETLVSYHNTARCQDPEDGGSKVPPKHWYTTTLLHGVIIQKMEAVWSFKTLVFYSTLPQHYTELQPGRRLESSQPWKPEISHHQVQLHKYGTALHVTSHWNVSHHMPFISRLEILSSNVLSFSISGLVKMGP